MIKVENARVEIKGSAEEVMTDLTLAIVNVRKCFAEQVGQEKAEKRIEEIIKLSKMSDEEIVKETMEILERMMSDIEKDILGGGGQNRWH